jgi:hypothetical protein
MNLKITLTVEPDAGEQLVGLLAKAYGRGELGVSDLRIEREGEAAPVRQSTIAKRVEARAIGQLKRKGRFHPPREGTGAMLALGIVATGGTDVPAAVQRAFIAASLSADGAGATLSKLGKRGFVRNVGLREWTLTAKGEAFMKERRNERDSGARDDRKND